MSLLSKKDSNIQTSKLKYGAPCCILGNIFLTLYKIS